MKLVSAIVGLIGLFLFVISCTRDQIMEIELECQEEVTYNGQMKFLLEVACSYAGCHNGSAPGDFTNYEGVAKYADGDLLERRVLQDRNMPPSFAVSGPTELTEEELEMFKCWAQNGYPEN